MVLSQAALTLLLLVPGLAAVWLLAVARTDRAERHGSTYAVALGSSVVALLLAVVVALARPDVDVPWVPALGVRWHLGPDGISVPLVLLTAVLGVVVVVHSRGREPARATLGERSLGTFYACLLLVETGALATFLARDAIVFFVAFEVVLVPMWVLVGRFGDEHATEAQRTSAAARFVLFTVLGSTLMLLGILLVAVRAGTTDLVLLAQARGEGLDHGTQVAAAALLLVGLGIKIPLWPAHPWLPPAHTVAPTAGSVLLAAVLLKMGTYGVVRLALPVVPAGVAAAAPYLAVAGAVGILWGGLACLVETDLKRLVAYSSVAHMGFVALGLASGTWTGLQAALFANIAHGVVSALLFLVVGGLKERWGSADLRVARPALRDTAPRLGWALVVGFAAALGLPGLIGFWGEVLAVYAAFTPADGRPLPVLRACAVAGLLGMVLAAAYGLRVLRLVWAGGTAGGSSNAEGAAPTPDAGRREWAVVLLLCVLAVAGGVLPKPLLGVTADDARSVVGGTGPVRDHLTGGG
ncbi:complex I subunit 4 family protein [Lapillicoccus jejuensis]|uniref:NADH dehydrogenase subunit M n=1 Tax=Lapillicoccus jejuensis TaxID=402171 RepID=A0A542DX04_9MICO|nr:NADH-quinone oxidoreductase subunit M [Lapillicoccus jejuensis]TQJ07605.1 NADH dehydrogenase subunit M [Lapillicoccus jejuensis]